MQETASAARSPRRALLPDPPAAKRTFSLISVDDHLVEPPDLFVGRLPDRFADDAPRVVEDDGVEYWQFEDVRAPNMLMATSAVGHPRDEWTFTPQRFDEMRRGSYDIHERIRDMDLAGIYATLNFPSTTFGFCGQVFSRMKDQELGLACLRAYNDWIADEWTAPYPDRVIPQQAPWLNDVDVACLEVLRNAERGFKAVCFSENPEPLGLPSLYSGYWDPFFAVCEETQTVVNLHVGSSSRTVVPSADTPLEAHAILFPASGMVAAVDWLYAGIPNRFHGLQIAFSEAGIGWVPMVLDRLARIERWADPVTGRRADLTENFRRCYWFTSIEDPAAFRVLDYVGPDRVMLESDYPHTDSTWPGTQEHIQLTTGFLPAETLRKIVYANASTLYRHPTPPAADGWPLLGSDA